MTGEKRENVGVESSDIRQDAITQHVVGMGCVVGHLQGKSSGLVELPRGLQVDCQNKGLGSQPVGIEQTVRPRRVGGRGQDDA